MGSTGCMHGVASFYGECASSPGLGGHTTTTTQQAERWGGGEGKNSTEPPHLYDPASRKTTNAQGVVQGQRSCRNNLDLRG